MGTYADSDDRFVVAGSNDGETWSELGGSWPGEVVNAPMVKQHNGEYFFHVANTYDNNWFIIPWRIGKADSSGVVSTIATIDWTAKITGVTTCFSGMWYEEGGTIHLFVPCGTNAGMPAGSAIYETHALDGTLTSWSDPVAITIDRTNIYDPKVFKVGSTYYMWLSHEDDKCIELASSNTLLGPYTMQRTGDWAGWGCTNTEGPTLYHVANESTWRIAIEHFQGPNPYTMWYSDCDNVDFLSCTWTAKKMWAADKKYRHGSIVKNW